MLENSNYARRNLPQKVVNQLYQAYSQVIKNPEHEFSINKEDDFYFVKTD
jgi:hypothetical protein